VGDRAALEAGVQHDVGRVGHHAERDRAFLDAAGGDVDVVEAPAGNLGQEGKPSMLTFGLVENPWLFIWSAA
jgi:hypothetical protein